MGDSSQKNRNQNVVFWSWKKGQNDGDSLDGEEIVQQYYSAKSVKASDSESSSSDDVDKEEEKAKSNKIQQQQQHQAKNTPKVSHRGNVGVKRVHIMTTPTVIEGVVSSVVKRPKSGGRSEENRSSKEKRGPPSADERATATARVPRSRQQDNTLRHTSQQERRELARKKLRKSLELPSSLSPNAIFDISKTAFRQQKLPILWQPIWNCKSAGRLLLILAICTLPLAVWLFFVENSAREYRFTFGEECKNSRNYLRLIRSICVFCGGALNPHCSKVITIPEDMQTPVFLYYELIGFHQNHRKISKSYDNNQLFGNIFKGNTFEPVLPSEDCGQYSRDENGKIYFPCGQLANVMYNDDFSLETSQGQVVPLRTHGIAHNILKKLRFRNPPMVTPKDYEYKLPFKNNFVKPRDWTKEMWDTWWKGGGMENERFINWMTISSLPHLRKLYAIIDEVPKCPTGVFCKGEYTMNIEYRYDVDRIEGNKAFILATTTYFGGQNYNLPLLVGFIGCIELALGLSLLQIEYMTKSIEHYNRRRRSKARKRKNSGEDKPKENEEQISQVIGEFGDAPSLPVPPPPTPQPVPNSSSNSVELVTRIPIVNSEENVGRRHGPRNKPQTEGLIIPQPPTIKKAVSESQVVLAESHSDSSEESDDTFYTTEEGETDDEDTAKSTLVSATEESSPETEKKIIDRNFSRKRR